MGTMELALPKVVEILGPEGSYEKRRIELKSEYAAVLAEAKKVTAINSAEDAERATQSGRLLQVAFKETESFFKSIKVQVDAIKAPVLAAEKLDSGPYEAEKKRIGALQSAWDQKVLREKEEADRKERLKADADAREEALMRAIEMESIGDLEAAEQALSEPIVTVVATLAKSVNRPSGSVNRGTVYTAKLLNLKAVVEAIAAGKLPINAVVFNQSFADSRADEQRDAFTMPGVELVKTIPITTYRR